MPVTFVLRVWLPDRPGALGAVASRIGAVRGDLVGIDILERGAGRVIDELVVELPSADLRDLLVQEVSQVDGVDVEDVRTQGESTPADPRVDALEAAATLVEQADAAALLASLTSHVAHALEAEWVAVVAAAAPVAEAGEAGEAGEAAEAGEAGEAGDTSVVAAVGEVADTSVVAAVGDAPTGEWLRAFLAGAQSSEAVAGGQHGPDDVACAPLTGSDLSLVLGRRGAAFRARERRQLAALARIAGRRLTDLS